MKQSHECPFCMEAIKAAAIKCKHCGSALGITPRRSANQDIQLRVAEKMERQKRRG